MALNTPKTPTSIQFTNKEKKLVEEVGRLPILKAVRTVNRNTGMVNIYNTIFKGEFKIMKPKFIAEREALLDKIRLYDKDYKSTLRI